MANETQAEETAEETKTIRFTQSAGIDDTVYRSKSVETFPVSIADAIIAEGNAEEIDPDAVNADGTASGADAGEVAVLKHDIARLEDDLDAERTAHEKTKVALEDAKANAEGGEDPGTTAGPVEIPEKLPGGHAELGHLAGQLGLPIRSDDNNVLSKADLTASIEAERAKRAAGEPTGE